MHALARCIQRGRPVLFVVWHIADAASSCPSPQRDRDAASGQSGAHTPTLVGGGTTGTAHGAHVLLRSGESVQSCFVERLAQELNRGGLRDE